MFQLILVVIGVALVSAMVLVTVNYLPGWTRTAQVAEDQLRRSLPTLESAFDVVVRGADGVIPIPDTGQADGGLAVHFLPAMAFTPVAPGGYAWTYGVHAADGSRYAGMPYFCLRPLDDTGMSQPLWVAATRVKALYPADQVILGEGCGDITNLASPTGYPVNDAALTLYVAYTPGVTR